MKTSGGSNTKSAGLFWDPNPVEDNVTGYRIHYGTASRDYSKAIDVGPVTTGRVTGLPNEHVFFAVTAYNAEGMESEFSDEVSVNFPTLKNKAQPTPLNIKLTNKNP